jgi:colanic acid/amylovoran biosynthesis glycosyltransferase
MNSPNYPAGPTKRPQSVLARKVILTLVPSLRARRLPDGRVRLTQKFIDGVNQFQRFWDGPVAVYMGQVENDTDDLDLVNVWPKDLPFRLEVLSFPEIERAITADRSAVVLLSLDDFRQSHLGAICRRYGVACAYVSEYSPATREQIIDVTTRNPFKRIRRKFWEDAEEEKRRAAISSADGLQCNGTPTYDRYRELCPDALLYFDTRVTEDLLATEHDIRRRLSDRVPGRPLRLVFSGRLAPVKGATQLIDVAKELRRLKVDFHLSICGDGESKEAMNRAIEAEQLSRQVSLKGILGFRTELLPFVKSDIDLFVCCHPQGDPSCTYLETYACGVPIAGYANEAFEGIVRSSGSGWMTPVNRPDELARTIAGIRKTPEALLANSIAALAFAKQHTFERTFSRRVDHLRALQARNSRAGNDFRRRPLAGEFLTNRSEVLREV